MENKYRLRKGQRVKLKSDGQDAPYSWAAAGAEGWVKDLATDKVGFPMVYIAWDKDHWTFNGEENQWTLEDHFEPVEEEMEQDQSKLFADFLKWQAEQGDAPVLPEKDDKDEKYQEQVARAKKFASGADAFLLISVEIDETGEQPIYNPQVYTSYKDEIAGLVLESQLPMIVTSAFSRLTLEEIQRRKS